MELPRVHFDPQFVASTSVSMTSVQEEIQAIESVSQASGECIGWTGNPALVSWRIKEDLTAAIEDEDYDPPTIHNISISEMEEEEEEQQPATASAIVQADPATCNNQPASDQLDFTLEEEAGACGGGVVGPEVSSLLGSRLEEEEGATTVHEGWIMKRGEHFKNWRQRYFMLKSNGQLLGYRSMPVSQAELRQPLNNFTAKDCQVMCTEEPRPNCLVLRGLNQNTVVERLFSLPDSRERDLWYSSITRVRNSLASGRKARRRVSLHNFHIIKVLGRGAFGKVVMCREKSSSTILAMKILKKSVLLEKQEVEHTKTENRVLQTLRHPFLVNLKYSFTTQDRVFFVMEYVGGGELFEHIGRLGKFPESWVAFYGAEITLALGYLHQRGIIYRDLKLENLILDSEGHLKIVDFGLCKDEIFGGRLAKTMCGTPAYMAPEVFVKREYNRAVDWWSLGVVIYEMATGDLPFYSDVREEMFKKIFKEKLRFPRNQDMSIALKQLIDALLSKEADRRLGAGTGDAMEVLEAPFFSGIPWQLLEKKKIVPPFKPQIKNETDNPYIAPEFCEQSAELTPTNRTLESCNFSDFSFKKNSWTLQSNSSREMEVTM